jgi:ABC-type nitrate/sulfonate/bicarbonate transport system permease component
MRNEEGGAYRVLERAGFAAGRAALAAAILLGGWKLLSAAAPGILPPPEAVLPLLARLFPGTIAPHLLASARRSFLAILLSAVAALPCGLALARVRFLDRLLSPIVYVLYPMPKIAFLPLLLLAFGLGDSSKIALMFLIVFFQVLVQVRDGARAIESAHVVLARSLGLGPLRRLFRVVIPAALPSLFSGMRAASGTAVGVLFFAESVSAARGLGYYVMDAWMRVAYAEMCGGILVLGVLGLSYFVLIDAIERIACPWRRGNDPGSRS